MKTSAAIALGLVASAQGFAPVSNQGRVGTELSETLFDKIFGLDLFAPVATQNDYGARNSKNVSAESGFPSMDTESYLVSLHLALFDTAQDW